MTRTPEQLYVQLLEKCGLIHEARGKRYGPFHDNLEQIATRWTVLLGYVVSPTQASMLLCDMKLDRIRKTPGHVDSYLDAVNYLLFAAALETTNDTTPDEGDVAVAYSESLRNPVRSVAPESE